MFLAAEIDLVESVHRHLPVKCVGSGVLKPINILVDFCDLFPAAPCQAGTRLDIQNDNNIQSGHGDETHR